MQIISNNHYFQLHTNSSYQDPAHEARLSFFRCFRKSVRFATALPLMKEETPELRRFFTTGSNDGLHGTLFLTSGSPKLYSSYSSWHTVHWRPWRFYFFCFSPNSVATLWGSYGKWKAPGVNRWCAHLCAANLSTLSVKSCGRDRKNAFRLRETGSLRGPFRRCVLACAPCRFSEIGKCAKREGFERCAKSS